MAERFEHHDVDVLVTCAAGPDHQHVDVVMLESLRHQKNLTSWMSPMARPRT